MEIKQGGVVSRLLADVPIPRMFRAEQLFPRERIAPADIPARRGGGAVPGALPLQNPARHVHRHHGGQPGHRQRGSHHPVHRGLCKGQGRRPLHRARHGSHGGATAEGQLEVLASYGITPEAMGCEIRSSMEVVELGTSDTGLPVYLDQKRL